MPEQDNESWSEAEVRKLGRGLFGNEQPVTKTDIGFAVEDAAVTTGPGFS